MASQDAFPNIEALYNEQIKPSIAGLETLRKKVQRAWLLGVPGVILLVFLFAAMSGGSGLLLVPIIAVAVGLIVVIVKATAAWKAYRMAFKEQVVAQIVKAINPGWSYFPDQMINSGVYNQSDIFRTKFDKYRGDDLVKGVLDKTDFECSELHTQYKQVTYDSKGRRQERWVTIFKGLFFHADFNKEFVGRTYVSPDVAEKMFGRLGRKFQKFSGPAPLVVLENIEFEKAFVVHATDQIEARYILTPAIMEALLKIKKLYNCDLHFSFIGSRVYCALSMNKNLFEPKVFGSVIDLHEVENMHHLFKVNETIIHELNLNTRIWTKE
jgi:hypothetical protein